MNKKNTFCVLVVIVVLGFFFGFGPRVANDFPFISRGDLLDRFNLPQTWTDSGAVGFGENALSLMWGWPLSFLYGIGAKMGLSFSVLERVLGFIPIFTVGFCSMNKLAKYLNIKNKFISSFFYIINTYFLLLVDGGQLNIALAYAIFPLAYLSFDDFKNPRSSDYLRSALTISFLGFSDIRFVYVLAVMLSLRFVFLLLISTPNKKAFVSQWLKKGLITFFVFVLLNSYWIVPMIFSKSPQLPETYSRTSQTTFLSFAEIGHAMLLLQPHWYKNVFGKVTELLPIFYLIPILVFLAPALRKKNKELCFWFLISLIGTFLVKGTNPPFTDVYSWLFTMVPGFSIFRDPTKFFFLVCVSYSVLIGFTVDGLIEKFKRQLRLLNCKIYLIQVLLTTYLIVLVSPVWLNKMTGTLSVPYNKKEFLDVSENLSKDFLFGRTLWVSSISPLGYFSPVHPAVETSRIFSERPFATGVVGSYETNNFLREASYMGELFDIFGVKYIVYPYPDARREDLKEDNVEYYYSFLDQLTNLPWIEKRLTEPPVALLETKETQDKIFIADNTFFVTGSDSIYDELMSVKDFKLSDNAFIFTEDASYLGQTENFKVLAYGKSENDYLFSTVSKDEFVFPSENLPFSPSDNNSSAGNAGWWKRETSDFFWMRNFIQEKYQTDLSEFDLGGGYAISEGENTLNLDSDKINKGDIVFARVLNTKKGGLIEFSQGETTIGVFSTNNDCQDKVEIKLTGYKDDPDKAYSYDCAYLTWLEVGKAVENNVLKIKTKGEVNIINTILSLSDDEYQKLEEKVSDVNFISWNNLTDEEKEKLFRSTNSNIDLNYQRITPTKYTLIVNNLSFPSTLIFSEKYDNLWQIKNLETGEVKNPYPVYSQLNGFYISEDGEYEVYYTPQKYVLPGFVVSISTLLLAAGYLVISKRKRPQ